MIDVPTDPRQEAARERLSPMAYDYYAGGAETQATLAANLTAWSRFRLRPRVLRDVSAVSTATSVLGTPVASPVLVAPTAYHRLAHPDGEAATARAAAAADTVMIVSTLATTSLEDVAAAAPDAPRWFQLYIFDDREVAGSLMDRAREAGYRAIVLTVDAPVLGYRPSDEHNRFQLPPDLTMPNLARHLPSADGSGLAALFRTIDKSLTFDDLGWIRERAGLPLVVKGLHRGDDAARCIDAGADAVVVSNHGGRQCDGAVSTAEVLDEVVTAVDGRAEVYVDGGIRTGTDVVKALALGARAVLIGRPVLWALATDGEDGVRKVLDDLQTGVHRTLTLCGVADATGVPRDLVTGA
jgi:4-hydroxymandelate oxidase